LCVFDPAERFNSQRTVWLMALVAKENPALLKSGAFKADRGWKVGTTQARSTRHQPIGSSG